ncbi:efflux RND transporter periplasmic adaptor subunit [Shewanella eurypsychrophilus]|uniref:Efflux RND transporter periplasmic adaptor subunit n=1 Tax=Shewanella eurypsychrophilus TaxID=2593656 RepID=A0ABX6VB85_9GAMM|nr:MULTISPECIES: efflux RND transporter periplasmic adaptor subunit [Shewanella]QFU23866.1 efflux RND transporter periplasmic adaptor subunit [Shewanella sp. YLB-09]QPG59088.1 efflux RND transporter periplasmic adaptor subunit [Shewanella eurypsychrophilus]
MKKSLLLIPLLAVIAIASFSSFTQAKKPGDKSDRAPRVVPVVTGVVDQHLLSQTISLIGKLESDKSVYISPEVTGKVKAIKVTANQEIKAGQLLIELEDAKAQASVSEANAYLNDEKRKLREYLKLIDRNAITQTEIDAQKASVDIAKARLELVQADLDYHYIKAPFSGTAGLLDFSRGTMVTAGSELFTLDDLSSMRVDLQVPENYLSMLSVGMLVTATNRAWPEDTFTGHVVAIDPRINQETLNLKVRVSFDNSEHSADHKLKPGMLMSATLSFPAVSEPVIPVQAIEYSGTKRFVYVVSEDKLAKRTEVFLGARIQDEVMITSGLAIGDRIVVQGLVNMRDGLRVDDLSIKGGARTAGQVSSDAKGDRI